MKSEDQLDELLNRARPPEAPGWFTAKVMARIRREREASAWQFPVFVWSRRLALAGCAAALMLAVASVYWIAPEADNLPLTAEISEEALQQEAVFTALDELTNHEEEYWLWSEENLF